MLQSSVKLSTCDQWNPFVVEPSSTIGWQAWSGKIGFRLVSGIRNCMGFLSYFGQRVGFLLAPSASKKWALSVAAFIVLLSVSLETYIFIWGGTGCRAVWLQSNIFHGRHFDMMSKQEKHSATKNISDSSMVFRCTSQSSQSTTLHNTSLLILAHLN